MHDEIQIMNIRINNEMWQMTKIGYYWVVEKISIQYAIDSCTIIARGSSFISLVHQIISNDLAIQMQISLVPDNQMSVDYS